MRGGKCDNADGLRKRKVRMMIRPTRNVGVLLAVALALIILSSFRWMHTGVPLPELTRPQQHDQEQPYRPQDEEQQHAKPVIITPLPIEELENLQPTAPIAQSIFASSSTMIETASTTSGGLIFEVTSIISSTSSTVWYEVEETTIDDPAVQVTSIVSSISSTISYEVEETTTDDLAAQATSITSSSASESVWYEVEETTTIPTLSEAPIATVEIEQQTTSAPDNFPSEQDRPPKLEDLLYPDSTNTEAPPADPTPLSKAIVIGRMSSEDIDWVAQDLPDWQHYIYTVDLPANGSISPTGLRTPINKGRESMPYLTYIIDHYDSLPDISVFLHAHRKGYPAAWHNDAKDYDAVNMLHDLQLPFVQREGYANLRCRADPGCPAEIQPWREPFDADRDTEHVFPFVYGNFFNKTFDEYRHEIEIVATQCCAQFAASRDQIRKNPRSEYIRWRQFIIETEFSDALIGRVLEYMWHIMFGRGAVQCTEVRKCWCEVFGRCDDWAIRKGGG